VLFRSFIFVLFLFISFFALATSDALSDDDKSFDNVVQNNFEVLYVERKEQVRILYSSQMMRMWSMWRW